MLRPICVALLPPTPHPHHAGDALLGYGRDYPLRPEMIESAYHLYSATRHPHYLTFAHRFTLTLRAARTPCGYASIADVTTGRLDDRMDSFFLSETLKVRQLARLEMRPRLCKGSPPGTPNPPRPSRCASWPDWTRHPLAIGRDY